MSDINLKRLTSGQTSEPHCNAVGGMAILNSFIKTLNLCAQVLQQRGLPREDRVFFRDFDPDSNEIKVMTMKVSKAWSSLWWPGPA